MSAHTLLGRLEDRRLVTGAGRYTSDRNLAGQLYAAFLRADRAHADIVSIDASAALAMPGVHAVLTGEDIAAAGFNSLPTQLAVNGRDGKPLIKPHRPALAQGKVRFVGECVACVVADSAVLAQDAVEALAVEYRDLPAVTRAAEALAAGAPQLHDNVPANRVMDFGQGNEEATTQAFARAAKVARLTIYNNRVAGSPLEPRSAIGDYDAKADRWTLYSTTQGVNGLRAQFAGVLGVTEDKVDIVARDVGGGFGMRSNVYPEYAAIALASKKLGRPVKWTGSRSEAFLGDEQGRDVVSTGEIAMDANGRFLAMRYDFHSNLGAYCAFTGPFISMRASAPITGVYDIPAAYIRNQFVLTNTAPIAAYRGAGRPIMSAITERLVNEAARVMGLDPAEIRRRNFIPRDKFPYKLVNDQVYDCGDPLGVMEDAAAAAGWNDKAAFDKRRAGARARGRLLGRGMASCIESTGAGGAPDEVELRFGKDGSVNLYTVSHSSGQGHETAFAQIVAGVLGMPLETVKLVEGDPAVRLLGNGTGGSRSTHGAGSVLKLGSDEVVKKGMALASEDLEAAEADLEFRDGAYRVKGTDKSVSLVSLVKKHAPSSGPHPLDVKTSSKIGVTWPNGCHIAEVEIDPATGVVELQSYVACDDAGEIINHQLVEGQMHGGLAQGIGQVLGEHAMYDPQTGQLLTGSFMDYPMPRAGLLNGIKLVDHPVRTETNPLGAKGVGESGVTGSLPTVMNAILDALSSEGVSHFDMPATPARVWAAIQAARAGQPAALAVPQR
jgi:carbon-monoxide dehydrogenase large subunit